MGTLRLLGAIALGSLVTAGGLQDKASLAINSTTSCTTTASATIVTSFLVNGSATTCTTTIPINATAGFTWSSSTPSFSYSPVSSTESSLTTSSSSGITTSSVTPSSPSIGPDSSTTSVTSVPSDSGSGSATTSSSSSTQSSSTPISWPYAPTTSNSTVWSSTSSSTSSSSGTTPFAATTYTSSSSQTSSSESSSGLSTTAETSTTYSSLTIWTSLSGTTVNLTTVSLSSISTSSSILSRSKSSADFRTSNTLSNGTVLGTTSTGSAPSPSSTQSSSSSTQNSTTSTGQLSSESSESQSTTEVSSTSTREASSTSTTEASSTSTTEESLTSTISSTPSISHGNSTGTSIAGTSSSAPFGNSTASVSQSTTLSTTKISSSGSGTTAVTSSKSDLGIPPGNGTTIAPPTTLPPSPVTSVYSTSGMLTTVTLYPLPAGPTMSITNRNGTLGTMTIWQSTTWATTPPSTSETLSLAEISSTTAALSTFTGDSPPSESVGPTEGIPSPFVTVFPTDGTSTTMTFWPAYSPTPSLSITTLPSTTSTMSLWPSISWETSQPSSVTEEPTSASTDWSTFSSMPTMESTDLSTFTGSDDSPPAFLTMTSGTPVPYITVWSEDGQMTTQTVWPMFTAIPTSIYTLSWEDSLTTVTTSAIFPYVTGSVEDQYEVRDEQQDDLIAVIDGLRHCIDIFDIGLCEAQVEPLRQYVFWLCGWLHFDCSMYTGHKGSGGDGGGPNDPCYKPKCGIDLLHPVDTVKCFVQQAMAALCDILNHDINGLKLEFPQLHGFSIIFPKLALPPIDLGPGPDPNSPTPPEPTPDPTNPTATEPTTSPTGSETSSSEESCTETITATNTAVTCSVGPAAPGSNSTTTACSSNTQITRGCSVTPTVTTTTIRSCSQTSTVTDAAVNCSQTVIGASWTDVSLVCSTTTSLVSGCDVTATTTTSTAFSCPTSPVQPSANGTMECLVPMCSSDLCGEACDWHPQQNISTNSSLVLSRDLFNSFVLSEPESVDASAFNRFMLQQFRCAKQVPQPATRWPPKDINDPARWGTTAIFMPFEDHPDVLAVGALYGCTTVVVASHQGAWMSHIWEIPTFATSLIKDFKDPAGQLFTGNGKDASISGLEGYMKPMGSFDPNGDYNIKVWIVTPIDIEYLGNPQPDLEHLRWPRKVTTILDMLKGRLKVTPNIITYTPLTKERRFYNAKGELDKAAVNKELASSARGKVILQYDPKQIECSKSKKQQAIWRLWVDEENGRKYVDQDMWDADEDQIGEESDDERAAFARDVAEQCSDSCTLGLEMIYFSNGIEKGCRPPRCSYGTCPVCAQPPTSSSNITSVTGNSLFLSWPGQDPGDWEAYMKRQTLRAGKANTLVRHNQFGRFHSTTAKFVSFGKKEEVLALTGLYGCTSVVVVSQKGAWMSHIWQGGGFERRVKDMIVELGDREWSSLIDEMFSNPLSDPDLQGLGELMYPGLAFGPDAENLRVYVFTPRKYPGTQGHIPPENALEHPEKVDALKRRFRAKFATMPIEIRYTPLSYSIEYFKDGAIDYETFDPALAEKANGKINVQYDPMQVRCTKDKDGKIERKQKAIWRLSADIVPFRQPRADFEQMWDTLPDQLDPNEKCEPKNREACSAATCGKCDEDSTENRELSGSSALSSRELLLSNGTTLVVAGQEWAALQEQLLLSNLTNELVLEVPDSHTGDRNMDFFNYWSFLRREWFRSARVPHGRSSRFNHGSTADYIAFGMASDGIALRGLWGCWSVVLISEKGCWMSHVWEQYAFVARPLGEDLQVVLDELRDGEDPPYTNGLMGFGQYMAKDGPFDKTSTKVHPFIIHNVERDTGRPYYQEDLDEMEVWLNELFGVPGRDEPTTLIPYVSMTGFDAFTKFQKDKVNGWKGTTQELANLMPFGRVLVQYGPKQIPRGPGQECAQSAARMYVDIPPNYDAQFNLMWPFRGIPTLPAPPPPPAMLDADAMDTTSSLAIPTHAVCTMEATFSIAATFSSDFYSQFTDFMTLTAPPASITSTETFSTRSMNSSTASMTSASESTSTVTNSTITSPTQTSTNSTSTPMTSPSASMPTMSSTNSSTTRGPTTTMPLTSCSLAPLPIEDNGGTDPNPLSGCACDSDVSANMVTMVGEDQTTTLGCAAGITFYTPVQTADPVASAAPLPTNFCKLHVEQAVRNNGDVHVGWNVAMELFDPSGKSVSKKMDNAALSWTQTYFTGGLDWVDSPNAEITFGIDPVSGLSITQDEIDANSDGLGHGEDWTQWLVQLSTSNSGTILSNQWPTDFIMLSTPQPFCIQGEWHPAGTNILDQARDLDFYWDCGLPASTSWAAPTSTSFTPSSTITEPLISPSTTTDAYAVQTCTVEVDEGPWTIADEVGQEIHGGLNVSLKISDASQQVLAWQWFSNQHDFFHEFVIPGDDWNDANGMSVLFSINPDTKEEFTGFELLPRMEELARTTWYTSWATLFRTGDVSWLANDTIQGEMPFCDVGSWEGNWWEPGAKVERIITCYWDCGQGIPPTTSTSSVSAPSPTPTPDAEDCRLHVAEQVLGTDLTTDVSSNAEIAGLLNISMSLYGVENNHHFWTTTWNSTGFNARYSNRPTNEGVMWNVQAIFGLDEGNAITDDTYDPAKWSDYDALLAMEMSIDGGATWSMMEYLRCQISAWTTHEVEQHPRREFECLFDCLKWMHELEGGE
ncbi:hypothetical protein M409DRAFT_22253 [Zasmidium cellare ATCC 36951]|uniref:Uncharacterized protein n=1 Tax=Zasmidium cellare ATCC 36951 TaxID=1080233 RepID=A0A6A6CJV8_ZASCE|nr:uncharacterized protein M409DRAFT_22253 [Zasmidium cellare ATCC 36951]KAF2167445.1 hypothetical protein M409DRAFT_22253 [Zasmidium cellare ATCC 36951]